MRYTEEKENALFEQWDNMDTYNEDYQNLIESLNSNSFFRTFGEGLLYYLQRKQLSLTEESAIKYIENICQETGIDRSDIASTNTLKNWFNGGPRPKKGEDSRSSMFALAFALRSTPEETAELFHKVYLDRAFDYRNVKEIIYYFCLQHNKSWKEAQRLISRCSSIATEANDHTIYTSHIRSDIKSILDEEMLLSYIAKHGHNLEQKSVSAKHTIKKLIDTATEMVEKETKLIELRKCAEASSKSKTELYLNTSFEHFQNTNARSLNHIYEVITGQIVRGEKGTKTLFKNARLPKEIKNRFPEAATLSKKDPTYEEMRKLVVMLASYNYWQQARDNNAKINIEHYIDDTDAFLGECGFSLLYYGNPYDWLFLYCSLSDNPLDTFRGILSEVLDQE